MSPLASVAATLACGGLLLTPAVSHADQPSITAEPATCCPDPATACPDIEVVFARGIAEPPGAAALAGSGTSVAVYGVEYPASYDFLHAIDGVNDAAAFIQSMAESCPQTKMMLGGYSQGAAVVTSSPQRVGDPWISRVRCRIRR